jgi:SAM-dependent methyltransferase
MPKKPFQYYNFVFREIHDRTLEIYDKHAEAWDRHRSRVFMERTWLDRFISVVPAKSSILDVGCGAGEPIAAYLLASGFCVTGVDGSPAMIENARSRFPDINWFEMDMRELALKRKFNGIVGWDSFFHLNPDEQRSTLQLFCEHLYPGGALLLTIGHEAGEVLGTVAGDRVYHSSLDPDEYRQILNSAGFNNVEITLQDEDCGSHTVLLASQLKLKPV